ncbi:hypothetical protein, partial [Bacteroides heparinolyticus]|uniref:hypothetical protein n=1 Tax=Prevotella heparinolytica TaxID=28113 RepID=UPI0035A02A38
FRIPGEGCFQPDWQEKPRPLYSSAAQIAGSFSLRLPRATAAWIQVAGGFPVPHLFINNKQ